MAIYGYRCSACGGKYQFLQESESQRRCPECGAPLTEVVKKEAAQTGAGWHVSDYRAKECTVNENDSEDELFLAISFVTT